MSGNLLDEIGPIVDIEFDGEPLDTDFEIDVAEGEATLVREYTVDKTAGEYDLTFTYKNDDMGPGDISDRNFVIENIEIADDGVNYSEFQPTLISEDVINEDGTIETDYRFEEFDVNIFGPGWEKNYCYPIKQWVNGTGSIKITFS